MVNCVSSLIIVHSVGNITLPSSSKILNCPWSDSNIGLTLPTLGWNVSLPAPGLKLIVLPAAQFPNVQNKNCLPLYVQSLTSPMPSSYVSNTYPIFFCCLPMLINKSKTSSNFSYSEPYSTRLTSPVPSKYNVALAPPICGKLASLSHISVFVTLVPAFACSFALKKLNPDLTIAPGG